MIAMSLADVVAATGGRLEPLGLDGTHAAHLVVDGPVVTLSLIHI